MRFTLVQVPYLCSLVASLEIRSPKETYHTEAHSQAVIQGHLVEVVATSTGTSHHLRCYNDIWKFRDIEEFRSLLGTHSWTLAVEESFSTTVSGRRIDCWVHELVTAVSVSGYDLSRLSSIGLVMLNAIDVLHTMRHNHRRMVAGSWGFSADGELKLVDYSGILSTQTDRYYYHRVMELRHLVLTLRFLRDGDERFNFSRNNQEHIELSFVCETDEICPPKLRELVKFVLSMNPQNGSEIRARVYDGIRERLLALVDAPPVDGLAKLAKSIETVSKLPGINIPFINPIRSTTHLYYIGKFFGKGANGIVAEALRFNHEVLPTRVAVKCLIPTAQDKLQIEYDNLSLLRNEVWVPRVHEIFVDARSADRLKCFSMDPLGLSVHQISKKKIIPVNILMKMGLKMLHVLKKLHLEYGLIHDDIHADDWLLEEDNNLDGNIIMIDIEHVVSVHDDSEGKRRLREFRKFIIALRFVRDLDHTFFFDDRARSHGIHRACEKPGICPPAFKELITYVFGLNGVVPSDVYDRIEGFFLEAIRQTA